MTSDKQHPKAAYEQRERTRRRDAYTLRALTRELNRTRQNGNLLSVAQVAAALDRARKEPTG